MDDFVLHHVSRKQSYVGENEQIRNLHRAKGGGVAAYIKQRSQFVIVQMPIRDIEGLMLKDMDTEITFVIIYKPSVYTTKHFLQRLELLLNILHQTSRNNIILGDFNENLLSTTTSTPIQKFMKEFGYHQLVGFATTENRTLIDHVYSNIPNGIHVHVCPTYYSYHEAIRIDMSSSIDWV